MAVSPGNYGLDYMKRTYGYDLDKSVKCSNFIGDTIDMAVENGFEAMLLTGHIGKMCIRDSGGMAHCFMADEEVAGEAKKRKVTRAVVSMEHAAKLDKPVIFAIGNAPTALIRDVYKRQNLYRSAGTS